MSGTVADKYHYSLSFTEGWYPLTASGVTEHPDVDALLSRLDLDDGQEAALRAAAEAVWQFARVGQTEGSERWVLIRNQRSGRIDAVLSLDLHGATGESGPDRYSELAQTGAGGDDAIEVINRVVDRREFPSGSAVTIHDFALPRPSTEHSAPASERAVVALFVADAPIMAEFALVTQDLGLSETILEALLRIVATFEIEEIR